MIWGIPEPIVIIVLTVIIAVIWALAFPSQRDDDDY